MAVRISSGKLKGRKVKVCSAGESLRPTSSKVRESLFNIIGPRIKGSVFVDLYAGTGAVGMEAMSREAGSVYFVEADRRTYGQIESTLEGCGCRSKAYIINMSAEKFIEKSVAEGKKFDIVFLDPPYASEEVEKLLEMLGKGDAVASDVLVIAEHPSKVVIPDTAGVLRKKKTYRYGDTSLTSMERKEQ